MFKTLKQKVLSTITTNPKLVTLGISLGLTFAFSIAISLITAQMADAKVIVTIGKPEIIERIP